MPGLESSSNNHGILFWIKLALATPPPPHFNLLLLLTLILY